MSLAGLLSFALVYFLFVATPGPGLAAIVARGLGIGARHGVPFLAGFVVGDLTWFVVAATGLSKLAGAHQAIFMLLKYCGCLYLAYLAYKMWRAPTVADDVAALSVHTTAWGSFAGSLSLTLSNPKVIVFFLSVMPLVMPINSLTVPAIAAMAGVMAIVCGATITAYLLLARQARRIFTSSRALRRINRGSALLMAGAAATIAVKA
jgi:threonine/homoserine/homoserine lactone efflux protein